MLDIYLTIVIQTVFGCEACPHQRIEALVQLRCNDFVFTDSYNERNPQWAVLKEPLYDHCRTNNHESMEAELELISFYPAHDDTETTSNQEQEYLEISEYNQPEVCQILILNVWLNSLFYYDNIADAQ